MLSDDDIAKLEPGRIIRAEFFDSEGKYLAGPHWAVIINTIKEIQESDFVDVVVISHNDVIDPRYALPIPSMLLLDGFVVCSWRERVHFNGIQKIGRKLFGPQFVRVLELTAQAHADKMNRSKDRH